MKLAKYGKTPSSAVLQDCVGTFSSCSQLTISYITTVLHNKDKWLIILGKSNLNMRSSHNDVKSFVKQHSYHRMARTNLKRSEVFLTNTTAASKYIPGRPRISINWNPPFQIIKFSKTVWSKSCFTMFTFRVTFTK